MLISAALFWNCATPPSEEPSQAQGPKEEMPELTPADEEAAPVPAPNLSAPKTDEIVSALNRVFERLVEVTQAANMSFVAGDFNGDQSQDIAVVVRPAQGSIEEINKDIANWTIDDPTIMSLDPHKATQPLPPKPEPVHFEQTELMLAIIHGYGPEGWRNPEARQTYLLKHAVGSGMKTLSSKSALAAIKDKEDRPFLRGDVIRQTIGKEPGFIYWTGGRYVWRSQSGNPKS